MKDIIIQLQKQLHKGKDEKLAISGQRFFKDPVKMYGYKTNEITKIAKEYVKLFKEQKLSKSEVFVLADKLWKSGYLEETFIACTWVYSRHKEFMPNDIKTFENWIDKYVTNWASCDTFCNHSVGELIMMYPENIKHLLKWTKSENRWLKRASAVSLIIPARKGLFQKEILEIATTLLEDEDDMVQKGYGWMLKAASEFDQKLIFDFVMKNKSNMPRTALRYAIEKMPQDLRKRAMKK